MKLFYVIINKFKDLKLRTKLILSYVFLIIIPTFLISYSYYDQGSKTILDNSKQNIYEIVQRNNQIIDLKMSQIEKSALMFVLDRELYSIFKDGIPNDDYALMKMDRDMISVLNKHFSQYDDIISTYIYTKRYSFGYNNISFYKRDYFIETILYKSAVKAGGKLQWIPTYNQLDMFNIKEFKESSLLCPPKTFSAVKQLNLLNMESTNVSDLLRYSFEIKHLSNVEDHPVLVLNFDESTMRNMLKNSINVIGTEYYIISKEGEMITATDEGKFGQSKDFKWLDIVTKSKSGSEYIDLDGEKMLLCYDTMKVNGWISVALIPVSSLLSTLPKIREYSFLLTASIIFFAIIIAFFISGMIVNPIKKLVLGTVKMREGNFKSRIEESANDEVGLLVRNFNTMSEEINKLIEENYKVTIREKEAQIMALNLQMNPHFLSNTLNIINWMAKANNQPDISKMIVSLSTMLQYTMRNTREMVRFEDDMEWLKGYVHIMSNRYTGMFCAEFDFPQAFYNQKVPKLFLQPFIENAILHGFEEIDQGGIIKVYGKLIGNTRYFYIEDNGKGMSKENINTAMQSDGSSIGIKNIDKRIKLIYGDDFGVNIQSQPGRGVKVEIRMPVDIIEF